MAQILTPGFLKWDGVKYILDPNIDSASRPTIINSGVGVLSNITSNEAEVPAAVIVFTGASDISLTGVNEGVESRDLKIFNTSPTATLTLKHLDNTSLTGNQIICPGGIDFNLAYRESTSLIYSNVDNKWRVVEQAAISGGGTPGGLTTQLQFNNNGAFGGVTNWSTSGSNTINISYHQMTDSPALEFSGTNTITRLFGSWLTDGFQVGDLFSIRGLWYDNSNVPQPSLNIVNATITNVTDTVLTITATISPAGYALSGETFAQGGGALTAGNPVGVLPDAGIWRNPATTNSQPDVELITVRDFNGDTVPIISVNNGTELMIGGTFDESNTAAGVTNRRPSNIAMWGQFFIDFTDERVWRDDKGAFYQYLDEFRAAIQTTNATPTQLINKSVSGLQPFGFIELYVVANKAFPVDQGATWKFFGAKTSNTLDWQTATYHTNTAGASAWNCTVTGDATVTVTGQAGTSINWRIYGRFI